MRAIRLLLFVLAMEAMLRPALADPLAVNDLQVDPDRAVPRLCLDFTKPLKAVQSIPAAAFVDLSPAEKVDVSIDGKRLCVSGLRHGTEYEVTVKPGLAAADGSTFAETYRRTAAIGDRPPRITFGNGTYVLPKSHEEALIPVRTINLDVLKLRLLRIDDRNIAQALDRPQIGGVLAGYDADGIAERSGEQVWQGEIDIPDAPRNAEAVTNLPLAEFLPKRKPGVYVLVADGEQTDLRHWDSWPTQWLVITDIGLSAVQGRDGLELTARSLETAKPLYFVTARLIARNNAVLAEDRTGRDGRVRFAPGLLRGTGGNAPVGVVATGHNGDYAFLPLTGPALDLSERGVEGRPAPGPVDAYLYTERGVYRPGEAVHLMALARDPEGNALPGLSLIVSVRRPDGQEVLRRTVTGDDAGGHGLTVPLSGAAPTGAWTVEARTEADGPTVGSLTVQVEDFVPQRLTLDLSTDTERLSLGQTVEITAAADYLYGAPGADLTLDGEVLVSADRAPFADAAKGFRFGLPDEDPAFHRVELPTTRTDANGKGLLAFTLEQVPDSTAPLAARLRVNLRDRDGRPVSRVLTLPIRHREAEVGVKPLFADDAVAEGAQAAFELIALGPDGTPLPGRELAVEWLREYHDYHWYESDGRWTYRVTVSDEPMGGETVTTGSGGRVTVARPVDWGRYRLEVVDRASGSAAGVKFRAGWWMSAAAPDTPDALDLTLDKTDLADGETLTAHLKAPFAGRAEVMVANDRVLWRDTLDLPEDGADIRIPASAAWGPGAYVVATAFRAGEESDTRGPGRAMGAAWVSVGIKERTLSVALDLPEEIRPNRSLTVPLTVSGAKVGREPMRVTVAAVDEGILQLTRFASPRPQDHLFGRRKLGVDLRDEYGRLIAAAEGARGVVRSGGDEAGDANLSGLSQRTTKAVVLYSGPVEVGADGKADISFDVPDFNGTLRFMAVAYGTTSVGSGEGKLLVRDPLIADLLLPRFLTPGDRAEATLALHNLAAETAGPTTATLSVDGPLAIRLGKRVAADLAEGQKHTAPVILTGTGVGDAKIRLSVALANGETLERSWDMSVRAASPYIADRATATLEPGASTSIEPAALAGLVDGTGQLALTVTTGPDVDVPALIAALDRYPYGCLEQSLSKAFPQLYMADLADAWTVPLDKAEIAERIDDTIARTVARQRGDGAFGLWSSRDPAEEWLTAYAVDFLSRAREQGHAVPETAYRRALDWLTHSLDRLWDEDQYPARAYAAYVLARTGNADPEKLRYAADRLAKQPLPTLARAHLAGAMMAIGDKPRALALAPTGEAPLAPAGYRYYHDYGSPLRDAAAVLAVAAESGADHALAVAMTETLSRGYARRDYFSTQEQGWLIRAVHALTLGAHSRMSVRVGNTDYADRAKPLFLERARPELTEPLTVRNTGTIPVRVSSVVSGVPESPAPADQHGFELQRGLYTLDGRPVNLGAMPQNQRVVVLLSGLVRDDARHRALVVDLLPAGWEIERASIGEGTALSEAAFLPNLTKPRFEAARDDRYVAAIDLEAGSRQFVVAYIARATIPGRYALPGGQVEDMYKPYLFARTGAGTVTVVEAE